MIKIKIRKDIGKKQYILFAVAAFLVIIGAWALASATGAVDEIFLPNPIKVVQYYIASIHDGSLWENTKIRIYII